jgi:hypothetical protein
LARLASISATTVLAPALRPSAAPAAGHLLPGDVGGALGPDNRGGDLRQLVIGVRRDGADSVEDEIGFQGGDRLVVESCISEEDRRCLPVGSERSPRARLAVDRLGAGAGGQGRHPEGEHGVAKAIVERHHPLRGLRNDRRSQLMRDRDREGVGRFRRLSGSRYFASRDGRCGGAASVDGESGVELGEESPPQATRISVAARPTATTTGASEYRRIAMGLDSRWVWPGNTSRRRVVR